MMLTNKVRRLPVLEGKEMRGIITTQDIMRWALRVSYEPNMPKHVKAILEIDWADSTPNYLLPLSFGELHGGQER